jgi:hypothetical protein
MRLAEKLGFDFVLKGRGFRGCGKSNSSASAATSAAKAVFKTMRLSQR